MKKIDKIVDSIKDMLKIANKQADNSAVGYDEGFYVGKGEGFEETLKLIEEDKITKINKLIDKVKDMLEIANDKADICKGVEYDEGFYVGKGESLEEVLKLLEENK